MNETRVKGTTSDEDAKGTAPDAKGDARGDVFDAATEGREPDAAASPRGATRDRPDDEPHMGVSRDPRVSKKPRLVWTPELHMRFMNAVNHLGIKRAVPKTILSLMNVEGMTRENVASHLQKYRLYLKRLAGLSPNAPLPADIMQRAQPYSAFPGSGTGMNVPFMPTMEQMHAGLPPTQPPAGRRARGAGGVGPVRHGGAAEGAAGVRGGRVRAVPQLHARAAVLRVRRDAILGRGVAIGRNIGTGGTARRGGDLRGRQRVAGGPRTPRGGRGDEGHLMFFSPYAPRTDTIIICRH